MKQMEIPRRFILSSLVFAFIAMSALRLLADGQAAAPVRHYDFSPKMVLDPTLHYTAVIETDKGKIICSLFAKDAPKTVNNFVFLARAHFYDGLTFHRVVDNFVIQGGDPSGDGTGGPGYQFEDEVKDNPHKNVTGTLAMANSGPNTNGSQFFVLKEDAAWLDGKHTPFGQVTQGMEVVNAIQQGDRIKSITIDEEKPATKP